MASSEGRMPIQAVAEEEEKTYRWLEEDSNPTASKRFEHRLLSGAQLLDSDPAHERPVFARELYTTSDGQASCLTPPPKSRISCFRS